MKGAYNANRYIERDCSSGKESTAAKTDTDNDFFTFQCPCGIIIVNGKGVNIMSLENISTAQLVEELSRRDGVEKITVAPYETCTITVGDKKINNDGGPAVILRIVD